MTSLEGDIRSLSIVVPVYNSEQSLPHLTKALEQALPALGVPFEVILVNDASADGSWSAIAEIVRDRPWMSALALMRNYGQHNALLCGIRAARHQVIVTLDDDLQHPPEEIAKLLAKLGEGFDVVYGYPNVEQHGMMRDLASAITKLALSRAMGASSARHVSAFRAFRTDLRRGFEDFRGGFVSVDVLLTWGASRFAAIPVNHVPRPFGKSQYTVRKLVTHALNMITGFSVLPLQLASVIGFAFTLFGMFVLTFVFGRYLFQGTTIPGFPFLASIVTIFSGAQLFALGIIGEYLARVHARTLDRPCYVVSETLRAGGAP